MISPLVIGRVTNGVFVPRDAAIFKAAFRCHENKDVEFQVKRFRKTRSIDQNSYYHGVIVKLAADAMGEDDPEDAHENLKAECNYEIRIAGEGPDRQEYRKVLSTAKLSTIEFEEYCERCRRFMAKIFSIYVPLPNEVI